MPQPPSPIPSPSPNKNQEIDDANNFISSSFVHEIDQMLGTNLNVPVNFRTRACKYPYKKDSVGTDGRKNDLSYEKMVMAMDEKHPRKIVRIDDQFKKEKFSTWAEPIGALGDSQKGEGMQLVPQMGPGVTVYFRMLRYLFWMYTIFTVMNLCTFSILGKSQYNVRSKIDNSTAWPTMSPMIKLSFGHLGEYQTVCDHISNPFGIKTKGYQKTAYVHCKYGTIEEFTEVGATTSTAGGCHSKGVDEKAQCKSMEKFKNLPKIKDCVGKATCVIKLRDIIPTLDAKNSNDTCTYKNMTRFQLAKHLLKTKTLVYYIKAKCQDPTLYRPFSRESHKITMSRTNATYVLMILDILICLAFVFGSVRLQNLIIKDHEKWDAEATQMTDFALLVKGLPQAHVPSAEVKVKIVVLMSDKIRQEKQVLKIRGESPAEQVVSIHLGMKHFGDYELLQEIFPKINEGKFIREKKEIEKDQKKIDEFDSEEKKLKQEIQEKVDQYKELNTDVANSAYVVFKSMEGRARMLKNFGKKSPLHRGVKPLYFAEKKLVVREGPDPSTILWENIGTKQRERCCRQLVVKLIALGMIMVATAALIITSNWTKKFSCTGAMAVLTKREAYDLQMVIPDPKEDVTHGMFCYCQTTKSYSMEFDDGEQYCDMFKTRIVAASLRNMLLVPVIIGIANVVGNMTLNYIGFLERWHTENKLKNSVAQTISIFNILNTGFVIFIVNLKYYDHFTSEWYEDVGLQMIMSLVMTIVCTQPLNAVMILVSLLRKCYDRGSCKRYQASDAKYTRQMSQDQYEEYNMGDEFDLAQRYSDIVNFFFVTMMFSAGLPVLYPIAAFFFGFYYVADKWMIINFYRKPAIYDSYIALEMMSWDKLALLMHCIMAVGMFSNHKIFIKECEDIPEKDQTDQSQCNAVYTYRTVLILIVCIWTLFRHVLVPVCDFTWSTDDIENESNFFEHCSYQTLRDHYHATLLELKTYTDMKHPTFVTTAEINTYLDEHVRPRLESIMKQLIKVITKNDKDGAKESLLDLENEETALMTKVFILNKQMIVLDRKLSEGVLDYESKIKEELQTYDIMKNVRFSFLKDLKDQLDLLKKPTPSKDSHI